MGGSISLMLFAYLLSQSLKDAKDTGEIEIHPIPLFTVKTSFVPARQALFLVAKNKNLL